MNRQEFCKMIDHTLLKPEATPSDILRICDEAMQYGFAAVCVNSSYVTLVNEALRGSEVRTCATVGFPLGAMDTESKAYEAASAVQNGAEEVDMVLHVGQLKAGNAEYVFHDRVKVMESCGDTPLKVIIEAPLLTEEEKQLACELCARAGVAFVKTATGWYGNATAEDVALMRKTVGTACGVKAAGGIRTAQAALEMIAAGATRIGTSAGVALATQFGE